MNAADDFLLSRAGDEVAPWLANKLYEKFCPMISTRSTTEFPNTCEMLAGVGYSRSTWPSKHALQAALQEDLVLLPICSSRGLLAGIATTADGTVDTVTKNLSAAPGMEAASTPEVVLERDELLLMASFIDNLAKGAPLVDDLIGLGRARFVQEQCLIDGYGLPSDPQHPGFPCPSPFADLITLSVALYYGANAGDTAWDAIAIPEGSLDDLCNGSTIAQAQAQLRNGTIPDCQLPDERARLSGVVMTLSRFNTNDSRTTLELKQTAMRALVQRLALDSNTLKGYMQAAAAASKDASVDWEGAASVIDDALANLQSAGVGFALSGPNAGKFSEALQMMFAIDMAARSHDYQRVVFLAWQAMGCDQAALTSGSSATSDQTVSDHASSPACAFETLVQGIANAQTEDELSTAMNDLSDPSGGWRYKMANSDMWAIGSVVGLAPAYEVVDGVSTDSIGAYAPVGLSHSWTGSACPLFGVLGLPYPTDCTVMLSFLDFGALASYADNRSGPGFKVDSGPRSTLASAVSLGISEYQRIDESPFVWGFSYEVSPNLRTVTHTGGLQEPVDTHRFMLFIGVDLVLHAW